MKAAVVGSAGAVPGYADFGEPPAGEGRQIVELVAAGIHPVVRSLAGGGHYGAAGVYPMIPGVDAVARTAAGDLVYTGYVRPPYGTIAERMSVPEGMKVTLPAGAKPESVAGGLNPGLSSWLPLRKRQDEVPALGTVLILGATGMAGRLAVQNALILGARRVVAVGRDPARLERAAALGAVTVRLPVELDAAATAIAGGLGDEAPGLVLDFVWGRVAEAAFAALGRRGLSEDKADIGYVQIGALSGPEAALPSALLRSRRIRVTGSGAGSASVETIVRELPGYIGLIAEGRVEVPVLVFPLSAVAEAWAAAPDPGARVVVVPG